MNHIKHSHIMIGLVAVGAVLFLSGAFGGSALFLLWPVGCLLMMVFMMRGMGGMPGKPDATHDDGVTHSHDDALTHSHQ